MKWLLTIALILSATSANAEGVNLQLKSETVATILALDPIPGDALFYAGKYSQGITNFLIGGASAYLVSLGFNGGYYEIFWIVGGIPYLASLAWDGIGGIAGVKEHNAKIAQKKTSFINTFQPTFAVTDNGAMVGAQFRF